MSKFAAIFAAVVMLITLGACISGHTDGFENTAIVSAV